ncbi:MAG TPA: PfkB family carbohydrate kinase [Acidobacteriaceae bacterium]|nr:PfkB family carbohydrate kinase [Acidobacteriaceae bacterium]
MLNDEAPFAAGAADKNDSLVSAGRSRVRPPFRIAAIGELLWDLLPDGPQLGGAPANFASLSANLTPADSFGSGDTVFLISRVGSDPLGTQALHRLRSHRVVSDFLSVDPTHPTGTVTVTLNAGRDAAYCIHQPAAWDFIPQSPSLAALAPTLDAICFGTLAQRSPVTRETLRGFVEATRPDCLRVFDVNLRAPYWNAETLAWGCTHASILKMNEEEAPIVARALKFFAPEPCSQNKNLLAVAHLLLERFPAQLVAITRGGRGCLLVTREATCDHSGIAVETMAMVDSIGAGDAFTAALTHAMLRHRPLPVVAEEASYWGSWAITQAGGMPLPDRNARRNVH